MDFGSSSLTVTKYNEEKNVVFDLSDKLDGESKTLQHLLRIKL